MYVIDCWSPLPRRNDPLFLAGDLSVHDGFVKLRDERCWKSIGMGGLYNIAGIIMGISQLGFFLCTDTIFRNVFGVFYGAMVLGSGSSEIEIEIVIWTAYFSRTASRLLHIHSILLPDYSFHGFASLLAQALKGKR